MKSKNKPVGQYFIEGLDDADDVFEYIDSLMPLIGEVVVWFNALESDINHYLCGYISDRSDQTGLIILSNLMYSAKVDLFCKFAKEQFKLKNQNLDWFDTLLNDLKDCGTIRNRIIHANWIYTDSDRFTQVKIKYTKNGLEHELWQLTPESLNMAIDMINETRDKLDYFIVEHS